MLNPYICQIEGDLSRADVVALVQLCRGKDVVEFGIGGSTIILSQVARSLITYETKDVWLDRFKDKLDTIEKTCIPDIRIIEERKDGQSVQGLSEPCDVLFNDGWAAMRHHFLLEFWKDIKECCILHDTRSVYAGNVVRKFFDAYNPNYDKEKYIWGYNPYLASLKTIEWNYLESNSCVLFKRNCELVWEDWKKTECDNNRKGFGIWSTHST